MEPQKLCYTTSVMSRFSLPRIASDRSSISRNVSLASCRTTTKESTKMSYLDFLTDNDPDLVADARHRIELRILRHQFGLLPEIEAFMHKNSLLAEMYTLNGMRKMDFAKRIIKHRLQFKLHEVKHFRVCARIMDILEVFDSAPQGKKVEFMEEFSSICQSSLLGNFVEEYWEQCCDDVSNMLKKALESNYSTLIEEAAFAVSHIAVTFPQEVYRKSNAPQNILKSLLRVFKSCYLETMQYTTDLKEARFKHLDAKLRGEDSVFSIRKFSTSKFGNHRLGSIIYYAITLTIGRALTGQLLYRIGKFAISSPNPVQYFLLEMLEKALEFVACNAEIFATDDNERIMSSRFSLSKLCNLFTACDSGEDPDVSEAVCLRLVNSCRSLIRSVLQTTILPIKSGHA